MYIYTQLYKEVAYVFCNFFFKIMTYFIFFILIRRYKYILSKYMIILSKQFLHVKDINKVKVKSSVF